jgi:hypothetical protein
MNILLKRWIDEADSEFQNLVTIKSNGIDINFWNYIDRSGNLDVAEITKVIHQ